MTVETRTYVHDAFVSYAADDRAWVEGFLLNAFEQAGIDYHSEATFALGRPRIEEFERGVAESQRTVVVLSHAYFADRWAELCGLLAATDAVDSGRWSVIPLLLEPVERTGLLGALTPLDMRDASTQEERVRQLCHELGHSLASAHARPRCPYPGMAPFQDTDRHLFFGRTDHVAQLVHMLRARRFLALIGSSGSGKSSLVHAGLVPALRASGLFGDGEWLVRAFRPGQAPMDRLSSALNGDPTRPAEALAALLSDQAEVGRLVLVVDQFEEVFTQGRAQAASFFYALDQLRRVPNCYVVLTVRADFYDDLMRMGRPLWPVIQTHRFEVTPLDDDGLRQAIAEPARSMRLHVESALVERLVRDAAAERELGAMPLIQETLVLLWEHLERGVLPVRAYEALVDSATTSASGTRRTGLQVAMEQHADAAIDDLETESRRRLARRILVDLVHFGDDRPTRRQRTVAQLRPARETNDDFEKTLSLLVDRRLLTVTASAENRERRVDLAHETLIGGWSQFAGWIDEDRELQKEVRRLSDAARDWQHANRDAGLLYRGLRLAEAMKWQALNDEHVKDLEREFLDAGVALEDGERRAAQQRVQRTIFGLLVALVVISGFAIFAFAQAQEAAQQRDIAFAQSKEADQQREIATTQKDLAQTEATSRATAEAVANVQRDAAEVARNDAISQTKVAVSRQLAAQAVNRLADQLDLALLLSKQAYLIEPTVEARGAQLSALQFSPSLVTFMRHPSTVNSLAFSPDGRTLATASFDGTVRLWDLSNSEAATSIGQPLTGHTKSVLSVAFSPDGKSLASASEDRTIRLWDVSNPHSPGPMGFSVMGHTETVVSVAFSPDGKTLASASFDRTVRLWDVSNLHAPTSIGQPLTGHTDILWSVAFSSDGKTLASASNDKTVRLWDVSNPRRAVTAIGQPLTGHTERVFSVAFSPDGKTLASASFDRTVRLWDLSNSQAATVIGQPLTGHTDIVPSVAFSPDGKMLASASNDQTVRLWDVSSPLTPTSIGLPLTGHTDRVRSVAFSPDGRKLASASGDKTVRVWDVSSPMTPASIGLPLTGHTDGVLSVAFSPDGRKLASASGDKTVRLWDVSSPMTPASIGLPLTGHTDGVLGVAFSPDGTILASGSWDRTVRLWDVTTRQSLGQPLTAHNQTVVSVAFSPNGKILASASFGLVWLWDVSNPRAPTSIGALISGDTPWNVAFSPDGKTLAYASSDNTVWIWDVSNPRRSVTSLGQPLSGHASSVSSVAFSPDGKTLSSASTDKTLRLWDVSNSQAATAIGQPLTGHTDIVHSVAFSPDGKTLASASNDKTVRLWDVSTHQTASSIGPPLSGHTDIVHSVAFSPDGKTLASASNDKTVRLWDVSMSSWSERICRIANRNLTLTEWTTAMGPAVPYRRTCADLPPGDGAPPDAP